MKVACAQTSPIFEAKEIGDVCAQAKMKACSVLLMAAGKNQRNILAPGG